MAIEAIRGCGYRKVNALYIVGEYISSPCDRLPLPLTTCPVCGGGIKVSRAFTEINPYRLWGDHEDEVRILPGEGNVPGYCSDTYRPCHVCDPPDDVAFIMMVGEKYYSPESFMEEAGKMGVSKKIPFIPKKLKLGETIVYLAHPKACLVKEAPVLQHIMAMAGGNDNDQPRLLEAEKEDKALGIFCAFKPHRVEKLVWQSQANPEELEKLEHRGISPVIIPDGDKDHA
ncbi:hypothetical protein ES703_27918 [subsurface metagenome]